jgi:ABC-type glycerol-3-phosphate transport system substrate-binding protein
MAMMHRSLNTLGLILLVLLNSCQVQTPSSINIPSSTALSQQSVNLDQTPTSDTSSAVVITIWLPPAFDTAAGNLAASMLAGRLAEFTEQHPQVRIQTRVKAEDGTGGLLDSLLSAQTAAPLSQPDLILLPHLQLETAVQSRVLYPMSELTSEHESDDWYSFAENMITVEGQAYALPFAADALVVAHRPTAISKVPPTWAALIDAQLPLGLAVADPWAQFTQAELFSLQSNEEETEVPFTQDQLVQLFEFYAAAEDQGVFPFWLTQYETYEQSWQAFIEGRVPMVVAWTSQLFDSRNVEISGAPLPTKYGDEFTLVKGWVWAISTPYPDRASLVAELAEFLSTAEFIAQWTAAAGMLPPRTSSLAAWSPDAKQALASQIIGNAQPLPPRTSLELWGQPLAQAMTAILKKELSPDEAMRNVLAAVTNPE